MKKMQIILIVLVCFMNTAFGQSERVKTYTLDEIIQFLNLADVKESEIIADLNNKCVEFKIDINNTSRLVKAGASVDFIEFLNTKYCDEQGKGSVIITSPKNSANVGNGCLVSGDYHNVDQDIWVVIWPENDIKGWPQSPSSIKKMPAKKENYKWSVYCSFGGPGQSYEVVVYTATPEASKFIGDKIHEWAINNDYVGLFKEELPVGLAERGRITVKKL
jgi:hypothetical protein